MFSKIKQFMMDVVPYVASFACIALCLALYEYMSSPRYEYWRPTVAVILTRALLLTVFVGFVKWVVEKVHDAYARYRDLESTVQSLAIRSHEISESLRKHAITIQHFMVHATFQFERNSKLSMEEIVDSGPFTEKSRLLLREMVEGSHANNEIATSDSVTEFRIRFIKEFVEYAPNGELKVLSAAKVGGVEYRPARASELIVFLDSYRGMIPRTLVALGDTHPWFDGKKSDCKGHLACWFYSQDGEYELFQRATHHLVETDGWVLTVPCA